MYKRRAGIAAIVATGLFLLPFVASAAGLVPCGAAGDPGGAVGCQACNLVDLLNNIISFLIGLSIPIAMGLFAYAGILYFTSAANPGNVGKAKKIFKNVFIGIVLALLSYIIVQTVLHTILAPDYWQSWNQIQCVAQADRPTSANIGDLLGQALISHNQGTDATGGAGNTGGGLTPIPGATLSDAAARQALATQGILVNKTQAAGTSLEGVREATIRQVLQLQLNCRCALVVTGGTESGVHADGTYSHSNGYKVDLRPNTQLDTYITTNGGTPTTRSDGATVYTIGTTVYARESDHWDVLVP